MQNTPPRTLTRKQKTMNKSLIAAVASLAFTAPALADKPEAAGKEVIENKAPAEVQARVDEARATAEEKRLAAEEKRHEKQEKHLKKEEKRLAAEEKRLQKEEKRLGAEAERLEAEQERKGFEEQKMKKAEQERKEMGKGSEKGQAAREEHSKKWWQFWK